MGFQLCTTSEFKRLAKIRFDARVKQEGKSLASKSQVDNALDKADKNREKIKNLWTFNLHYFTGIRYFGDNGSQNCLTLKQSYHRNPKFCQMKALCLLLDQN